MLKQIRIQNFKSIKDVTLDLEQVNLFIGPNNSGKSNVLKALEFFSEIILSGEVSPNFNDFLYKKKRSSFYNQASFSMLFTEGNKDWIYQLNLWRESNIVFYIETSFSVAHSEIDISTFKLVNLKYWMKKVNDGFFSTNSLEIKKDIITERLFSNNVGNNSNSIYVSKFDENADFVFNEDAIPFGLNGVINKYALFNFEFQKTVEEIKIYTPDISLIKSPNSENKENLPLDYLEPNCYNLAEFLFNFSQNHKKNYNIFLDDFKLCIHDFVDISTPYDPYDKTKSSLKLKFFDSNDIGYWIDEVSDGVIYFLALLAIIHQPNPPKILMLEEPETGIHPRRIKEIIDYIFKLAYEKNIQVILTSHSPLVLNKFSSSPQSVTVFDKENGETKIKNLLKDIIDVSNAKHKNAGVEEINYVHDLGESWLNGFIGGIPDEND